MQWYERTAEGRAAEPVDDVIVFPGEAMLEKVRGAVVLRACAWGGSVGRRFHLSQQATKETR